ncbi:MAG: hypothetical protein K6F72_02970 [Bacteroidales bacterium]|nr:hypothetical protein [Bacteroidales bacterium]
MNNLLSKFVLLLLAVPFFTASVVGQNSVDGIPTLTSSNSLIRNNGLKGDIIYNDNGVRSFSLIDLATSSVTDAVVPNLQSVSDMEIVNDMLYFCGVYVGVPVIGRFNISSFFGGIGSAEIIPVTSVAYGSISLNKLEVYFRSNNDIHVFVTAGISPGAPSVDYYAVLDAMYNGIGWDIECISDPNGDYVMSDLAITNSRLMVVGERAGHRGDFFNHYILPTTPATHLSVAASAPPIYMHGNASSVYKPLSQPITESLGNDEFVTACYGTLNGDTGIVVIRTDELVSSINYWIFPNVTGSTLFRDLRYSSSNEKIFLVPDINSSVVKDYMYEFDLRNGAAQVFQSDLPYICSVDERKPTSNVIVSGITQTGTVGIWQTIITNCRCDRSIDLVVNKSLDYDNPWYMNVVLYNTSVSTTSVTPTISKLRLSSICR